MSQVPEGRRNDPYARQKERERERELTANGAGSDPDSAGRGLGGTKRTVSQQTSRPARAGAAALCPSASKS